MFTAIRPSFKPHVGRRCYNLLSPDTILSEENLKKTVQKFAKAKSAKSRANQPTKSAAVLVPLCVVDDRVSLLYTLRAPNLKTHRGQVSFPGGMHDPSDQSFEHTALRETEEELGLSPDQIRIWGRGSPLESRGVISVLPIIGVVNSKNLMKDITTNPREVEEAFTITLEDLCNPNKIKHTQFRTEYSLPVYLGGQRRVWGLTAMITHLFLMSLLPRRAYQYNLKFIPPMKCLTTPY